LSAKRPRLRVRRFDGTRNFCEHYAWHGLFSLSIEAIMAPPGNHDALARTKLPSYVEFPHWREYQQYFPESWRAEGERVPEETWWKWRGMQIHIDRVRRPQSKLKLLLLHGGGANGRVLAPLGVLLSQAGYETLAPDLPGFGLTQVVGGPIEYGWWIDLISDLINEELRIDPRPIVLYGFSVGGTLAYQSAAKNGKTAGLIVTTLADLRRPEVQAVIAQKPWIAAVSRWLGRYFSWLLNPIRLPMYIVIKMQTISNNVSLVKALVSDPLAAASWMPLKYVWTLLQTNPAVEPENFRGPPLLFLQPAKDAMTPFFVSKPFYDRLACPKEYVELENAGHIPIEVPGVDQLQTASLKFLSRIAATIA
jgi:alpha-beta hydrolase superfamily lysophospholipase